MALLPDSPALNAITVTNAYTLQLDQRGVERPAGTGYDIGAFELGAPRRPVLFIVATANEFRIYFDAEAGQQYRLWRSPNCLDWSLQETVLATFNERKAWNIAADGLNAFYKIEVR